ncbi:MAG: sulfurtransferase [Phycisphaera sp.]|nr:sulfurtransferase [Phycisphaera sp.]
MGAPAPQPDDGPGRWFVSRHPWEIDPAELSRSLATDAPPILLDCREPSEVATASVDGALNVPMGEISSRLPELEAYTDREIVVMCHHGVRSLQVVAFLREAGFEEPRSLAGGIDRWSLEVDASVPRY